MPPDTGFTVSGQATSARPHIVVTHGGASGYAPENTLVALDEGHRCGAKVVEVHIRLTSDGQLVLMHDATLDRTTNVANVFSDRASYDVGGVTLEEIRRFDAGAFFGEAFADEPVPHLAEALDWLEALGMSLLLKVKEPAL